MTADEDLDQTGRFVAARPDGVRVSIGAAVVTGGAVIVLRPVS